MTKICFYSNIRGVGKSTLTYLCARLIQDEYDKSCVIIDTVAHHDENSSDLYSLREREKARLKSNNIITPSIYKITNFKEYQQKIKNFTEDFVFIDIQGLEMDNFDFICDCDYIFYITSNNENDEDFQIDKDEFRIFESYKKQSLFPIKDVYMVFNRIKPQQIELNFSEQDDHIKKIDSIITEEPIISYYSTVSPVINIQQIITFARAVHQIVTKENKIVIHEF